eukprot:1767853-Lingulodinium_polyedra.AAC.1
MCIAGVTCKDFSRMNKNRQGVLGPSGRILLLFIFEIRRVRYDLVITECTPLQDLAPFETLLGKFYTIESFLWGPEQLGWWVARKRRFTIFWLKEEYGGKLKPTFPMEMVVSLFMQSRPTARDGAMFAMASTPSEARQRVTSTPGAAAASGLEKPACRRRGLSEVSQLARMQLQR